MNQPMNQFDLDDVSFAVQSKNAEILLDGYNEYAFLVKFPPFSLNKNRDQTKEFIDAVKTVHYKLSAEFQFEDNFRPWKKIESQYASELELARRYRDDSKGNIQSAAKTYMNDNPKEQLTFTEYIGGDLEL